MASNAEEFKVILVGDSGVGKTSFVIRFTEFKFQNVHETTLGVDCSKVTMKIRGVPVELRVWDTAGQERFQSIVNRFYRDADGAILMYDVTSQQTFDSISWWLKDVRTHCPDITIFLVGNKNEDSRSIEVLEELENDFAEENNLVLYKTSARDNINVSQVFQDLATVLLDVRDRGLSTEKSLLLSGSRNGSVVLQDTTPSKPACCSYFDPKPTNLVI